MHLDTHLFRRLDDLLMRTARTDAKRRVMVLGYFRFPGRIHLFASLAVPLEERRVNETLVAALATVREIYLVADFAVPLEVRGVGKIFVTAVAR